MKFGKFLQGQVKMASFLPLQKTGFREGEIPADNSVTACIRFLFERDDKICESLRSELCMIVDSFKPYFCDYLTSADFYEVLTDATYDTEKLLKEWREKGITEEQRGIVRNTLRYLYKLEEKTESKCEALLLTEREGIYLCDRSCTIRERYCDEHIGMRKYKNPEDF